MLETEVVLSQRLIFNCLDLIDLDPRRSPMGVTGTPSLESLSAAFQGVH